MMRVVVDTNCLRASIPPQSPYYSLYLHFISGHFEWWVSTEILLEYEEVLSKTYSTKTANLILHQLATAPNVRFGEPEFQWQLVENEPDDNKFADLALNVNADFLVTNDSDFNLFHSLIFPPLNVIRLENFLTLLET